MGWNNRIIKHIQIIKGKKYIWYGVHEAFYDKGKKEPHSWTADPVVLTAETPEELIELIEYILKDCKKYKNKILNYDK